MLETLGGSRNVPWTDVLEDKLRLLPPQRLQQVFSGAKLDLSKPLVASCGSGLTAAILALAVYELTGNLIPIYDGSWLEYGAQPDTPIATDPEA